MASRTRSISRFFSSNVYNQNIYILVGATFLRSLPDKPRDGVNQKLIIFTEKWVIDQKKKPYECDFNASVFNRQKANIKMK